MRHSLLAELLGDCIKDSRLDQDITQADLASRLGFSAQFMGRIEKGYAMIPEAALIECIDILGLQRKYIARIYKEAADNTVKRLYK